MDETISWRAKLARSNINILDMHDNTIFVEFTYHPRSYSTNAGSSTFKWCKTVFPYESGVQMETLASTILDKVLALRKELENGR